MLKSNKFNLLLCSVFVCSTQFTNADFNEDWNLIQSEIKEFNESKSYLSETFQPLVESYYILEDLSFVLGDNNAFKKIKTNLFKLYHSFNNINKILDKISDKKITTGEISKLALIQFPNMNQELHTIFESTAEIFYRLPCYKTFSLLRLNIENSPEEIQSKYIKYASAPEKFFIKLYKLYTTQYYIFAERQNPTKRLFADQTALEKNLIKYHTDWYATAPDTDQECLYTTDTIFDILTGNVPTTDLGNKIKHCLNEKILPIPSNREQWPYIISEIINFLKIKSEKNKQEFSESLEDLFYIFYTHFNNPEQCIFEDFNPTLTSKDHLIREKFYNRLRENFLLLVTSIYTTDIFLHALIEYLKKENLFNENNAIRLLIFLMHERCEREFQVQKVTYNIKHHVTEENHSYELQLIRKTEEI